MSKSQKGFGRAGLSALATSALVIGTCAALAAPANAAAPNPTLAASGTPKVTQGATNQAAGDVTYEFNDSYTTNSTVKFELLDSSGNPFDCTTAAGISKAVGFSAAPTVTVTPASGSTATAPTNETVALASSGSCAVAGIKDEVVVTFPTPVDTAPGALDINVSNVKYNVGSATPVGVVKVGASSTGFSNNATMGSPAGPGGVPAAVPATPAPVANATVVNRNLLVVPVKSAEPSTQNNPLGTVTFQESTKGAAFGTGTNTVKLTLNSDLGSSDKFTAGITPTITVPSGYTYTATPTTAANTYTFTVTGPATLVPATVTVAGLEVNTGSNTQKDTITSLVTKADASTTTDTADALNVVKQFRIGGLDRYDTSVKLFNSNFSGTGKVVLSGSYQRNGVEQFADALSANYLAKSLSTGTMLTAQNSLPDVVKNALITDNISKVYITGKTTAISQAVQDEITSMHVGGNQFGPTIQVTRIGGENRYQTNQQVNQFVGKNSNTAVVAAGTAAFDSLSVGPVVYKQSYPLVLTNGAALVNGEESQLTNYGVKNVVIVGGTAVVSQAVQDQLVKDGYTVVRIAGATRTETAANIARWATVGYDANKDGKVDSKDGVAGTAQGFTSNTTNIADGQGVADALADGPVAGGNNQPLVLADGPSTLGQYLAAYLGTKTVGSANDGKTINQLIALGGPSVTTPGLMDDAAAAIGQQ